MVKDQQVFELINKEHERQKRGIELIASENFVSPQVMEAAGSVLTNKYAEGLPSKRYYGGCEVVDQVENLACERLKTLFGAEWANVQPHSGCQANTAVMLAVLKPGDIILGFDLAHGGHLSHGASVAISGKYYKAYHYGIEKETELINWNKVQENIQILKPKLVICGGSAYSRDWDYAALRTACDEVGSFLLADIAHPSGLIAKKLLNNPLKHCHFVTSTTHKTLRGPRGAVIMMGKDFENPMGFKTRKGRVRMMSELLDSAVFPGIQGGALEHIIAAKAIAFYEALHDSFEVYAKQVIQNAKVFAQAMIDKGYKILTGGTENHCTLIDLTNQGLSGKYAENTLGKVDITINKNMIPFDKRSPFITSGIRIGTSAITTRGLEEADMTRIAEYIHEVLHTEDEARLKIIKQEINHWMEQYPLYNS